MSDRNKEGYVEKDMFKWKCGEWKRRYLVFKWEDVIREQSIPYWDKKESYSSHRPRTGYIDISNLTPENIVIPDSDEKDDPDNPVSNRFKWEIRQIHNESTDHMRSATEDDREEWMMIFQDAVRCIQDPGLPGTIIIISLITLYLCIILQLYVYRIEGRYYSVS